MHYKWQAGENYPQWQCTKKSCRKKRGYLTNTWFEGTHLALKEVFQLSYYFCRQTHTQEEMMFDMQRDDGTQPGFHTLVDWMNFYREVGS